MRSYFDFCPSLSSVRFRYPISLLRYADKRNFNINKVYIEMNNLQLELIRYRKKMLSLFTFTFAKRLIQCNISKRMHIRKFRTQNTSALFLTV